MVCDLRGWVETPEMGDVAVAWLYLIVIDSPFLELAMLADLQVGKE